MKLTPKERRARLYEMLEADEEYRTMKAEFDAAEEKFTSLTAELPEKPRHFLWTYPGLGHFLYHKTLTLICRHMKFADEE